MTSQEIANELRLLLDGDNGIDPAPIRPWPEIVEACRVRGVFLWVEPITEWSRGYEVVCKFPDRIQRTGSFYSDLQDAVGLAAIAAIEALEEMK